MDSYQTATGTFSAATPVDNQTPDNTFGINKPEKVSAPLWVKVLQTMAAVLFVLGLLFDLTKYGYTITDKLIDPYIPDIRRWDYILRYRNFYDCLFCMIVWIIPFIIASNKQIRIAVAVLLGTNLLFIIHSLLYLLELEEVIEMELPLPNEVLLLMFLISVLGISYSCSLLYRNTNKYSPVNKWLVMYLVAYSSLASFLFYLECSSAGLWNLMRLDHWIVDGQFVETNFVGYFYLFLKVMVVIAYWKIIHSRLFLGYSKETNISWSPSAMNPWVIKSLVITALTALLIYLWIITIGQSLPQQL